MAPTTHVSLLTVWISLYVALRCPSAIEDNVLKTRLCHRKGYSERTSVLWVCSGNSAAEANTVPCNLDGTTIHKPVLHLRVHTSRCELARLLSWNNLLRGSLTKFQQSREGHATTYPTSDLPQLFLVARLQNSPRGLIH